MSTKQFLKKYLNKSEGYPDGQYIGECLSIVKLYIKECFGIEPPPSGTNSAYGYWSNFPSPLDTVFEKIENTTEAIITEGCIPIWKPTKTNSYGHIEICSKNGDKNNFESAGQNWGGKEFHIQIHDYNGIVGWLKPKNIIINSEINMTEEQTKVLSMLDIFKSNNDQLKNGNLEGAMSALIGWANDLKNYSDKVSNQEKKISDLESSINQITTKLDEIESKYAEKQKMELSYQKQLSTANDNLSKQIQITTDMTTDRDTWRTRYNNKNDSFNNEVETTANTKYQSLVDSTSGIDFIILGFKKLFIKK